MSCERCVAVRILCYWQMENKVMMDIFVAITRCGHQSLRP